MLAFALLGPLLVRDGDEVVAVESPKQRAILIRLLLDRGRPVSAESLIDDLWHGDAPPNPSTLRAHISYLRRALTGRSDADSLITKQATGYRIDVSPEALDTVVFERLAADGRAAAADGNAAEALDGFDRAMALWRGEGLADVSLYDFARHEITRLEQLHATVREDRVDALIGVGKLDEAIATLETLLSADPLRERPHAQLMQAFYRAARAPDALAVHDRFRDRLADEMGLDPSPAFGRLRDAILRQDPQLGPVREHGTMPTALSEPLVEAGATAPSSVVQESLGAGSRGVPKLLTELVGRDADRERLRHFLGQTRLLTLVGPGGSGKTSLAIAAASELADEFPDGVWFVPLGDEVLPERVAVAIAEAIGVPGERETATRQVAARLASARALLVLDNCEHLADACATVVEQVLRGTSELRILATSREALAVPGETQLAVPPLELDSAVELFRQRAAALDPSFELADHLADVREICQRLDGMPLAVELAAARTRALPPCEIAERLADRFGLLVAGGRTAAARHRTLRATVDWSHDLLTPEEQMLFRRVAVFAGGWTLQAAEEICGDEDLPDVLGVLAQLIDRSLAVMEGGRYRMLETIEAYAVERLVESGERGTMRERHARYFAGLAAAAETRLRGVRQTATLNLLGVEEHNFRRALAWARDHQELDPDVSLRLAGALGWYWYVSRQADGRRELIALLDVIEGGTPALRGRALQALSLGLRPAACIVHASPAAADAARASLALLEGSGDDSRARLSRLLLAVEAVEGHDVEGALRSLAAERDAARDVGDHWTVALADFIEMEIQLHQGDPDEALVLGRRSARLFDGFDDLWGRSAVRLHLGLGLRMAGLVDEAESVLEEARDLTSRTRLRYNHARALIELAEIALHVGDVSGAMVQLAAAGEVVPELADDGLEGLLATARGDLARLERNPTVAFDSYRAAAERFERSGGRRGLIRALVGAAATWLDRGDTAAAHRELETAAARNEGLADAGLRAALDEQRARLADASGDAAMAPPLLAAAAQLRMSARRPRTALQDRDVPTVGTSPVPAG